MDPSQRRLIVGISGASGVTYGVRLLELLRNAGVQTHLVMSKTAEITFAYETTLKIADVKALAHTAHSIDDMAGAPSRRSFPAGGVGGARPHGAFHRRYGGSDLERFVPDDGDDRRALFGAFDVGNLDRRDDDVADA